MTVIALNKSITSEEYHLNCDLKFERKINVDLLWDLCNLDKVIYLELYDEDMEELQSYGCGGLLSFELFKKFLIDNDIIKDIVYWELCIEHKACDVSFCYEEGFPDTVLMYMDGTQKEIDEMLELVKKIDTSHIKVVK